jgi:hypothetical protein
MNCGFFVKASPNMSPPSLSFPDPEGGEPFLLTPGPLTTSHAVKAAMLRDWGSWDSDFRAMTARLRRELLGLIPFRFKLLSFALSAVVAAAGGSVYLLLVRGATPGSASAVFTLNLIIMVVLGGLGRLWGAALGGLVFGYLQLRLPGLARSGVFDPLPNWLEGPLTEPLFILGALFVILVMFAPGGLASLPERLGLRRGGRGGDR